MKVRDLLEALKAHDPDTETNIVEISVHEEQTTRCVKPGYVASGQGAKPWRNIGTGKLATADEGTEIRTFPRTVMLWE